MKQGDKSSPFPWVSLITDAALGFLFWCIFTDLKCPLLSNNSLTAEQLFQKLISLHSKVKGRTPSAFLLLLPSHHKHEIRPCRKSKAQRPVGKGQFYGCCLSVMHGISRDRVLHVICHSETEKKQKKPGKLSPRSFLAWSCKRLWSALVGLFP